MDLFLIFNLAGNEVLIIAIVILLLFGGKKIPELMKGLGRGVREFNAAKNNVQEEIEKGIRDSEDNKRLEGK
ncbi:MAG: twin-arginine translocase TatA/TatE family subunit [Chitinophagales bacterium]|nr:twin-arginine translocase TatA/TatE family subunit [Chitinophagales bacterium]